MKKTILALTGVLILTGCQTSGMMTDEYIKAHSLPKDTQGLSSNGGCNPAIEDYKNFVSGGKECLAINTFEPYPLTDNSPLVIFLHGDKSNGGAVEWEFTIGKLARTMRSVGVVMLRPGYNDSIGKRSSGTTSRNSMSYTFDNIDAVAKAIQNLKEHYKSKAVMLSGFSGGAAYAGVIIGKYPSLADAAVLISCPCNISDWMRSNGGTSSSGVLSPHNYVNGIDKNMYVVAVTGKNDNNTGISLAQNYIADLKAQGVKAEFRLADGGHRGNSDVAREAIRDVIRYLTFNKIK